jgi:hypothetical protein
MPKMLSNTLERGLVEGSPIENSEKHVVAREEYDGNQLW